MVWQVSSRMNDVPYHNFYHVADVAHTVYRMITLSDCFTCMSQLEKFALMVAAVCHDMDHPGRRTFFPTCTALPGKVVCMFRMQS